MIGNICAARVDSFRVRYAAIKREFLAGRMTSEHVMSALSDLGYRQEALAVELIEFKKQKEKQNDGQR